LDPLGRRVLLDPRALLDLLDLLGPPVQQVGLLSVSPIHRRQP
jgi:hypothetical protein